MAAGMLMASMASCDDMFTPAKENIKDENTMVTEADFAERVFGSAYILLPYSSSPYNDVATDDAVSNDLSDAWLTMAGGAWTSQTGVSNDNWRDRNASIQYVNLMLQKLDQIQFSSNENLDVMFHDRYRGEALGLRALNMYYLLQNYGGFGTSGELLGVHIFDEPFDATQDMNLPRNTFRQCLDHLLADAAEALTLLPEDYVNVRTNSEVPAKYASLGVDMAAYNRVFGATTHTRVSGRIVAAVRAQAALLAASPAFEASGMSWAEAADYAAIVLDQIGGVAGMDVNGHIWYTAAQVGEPADYSDQKEILWRERSGTSCSLEESNFPPTLYGNGRVNPTQNLVDAFPALNGYPISDAKAGYNPNDPYSNRDPRLGYYIVTNGSEVAGSAINTSVHQPINDNDKDGLNAESGRSTRTGYYLRKLMREDVNPNSSNQIVKQHYTKRIRFTEIFLAYAEAANEAWGPTASGSHGYSAYDVIKAIRKRAGIGLENGDEYLESIKGNKEQMRELIRNERRLELCFENIRFWDLRRWKANLNETARGMRIEGNTYTPFDVERRNYGSHMIYGPIPYGDVMKFGNIEQNAGW